MKTYPSKYAGRQPVCRCMVLIFSIASLCSFTLGQTQPVVMVDDFQVNENAGVSEHYNSSITMLTDSTLVCVWVDKRNRGQDDIYTRRLDSNGSPIGSSILVNDNEGNSVQRDPCVTGKANGGFVIAWEDYREGPYEAGNPSIYAQLYDSTGARIGSNFSIGLGRWRSALASLPGGGFVVAYYYPLNTMARIYDADGVALGTSFRVNDTEGTGNGQQCILAFEDSSFLVAWMDFRDGGQHIFAQRYDKNGIAAGPNFRVSDPSENNFHSKPRIAAAPDAGYMIMWNDGDDAYFKGFNSADSALTPCSPLGPSGAMVAYMPDGRYVKSWAEYMGLYAQFFDSLGTAIDTPIVVQADKYLDVVNVFRTEGFIFIWEDGKQIYTRHYDRSLVPTGANAPVDNEPGSGDQYAPTLSVLTDENAIIAWHDKRKGSNSIFAQRVQVAGSLQNANLEVADSVHNTSGGKVRMAPLSDGGFIAAYPRSYDIFYRRFNQYGAAVGSPVLVNDPSEASQLHPDIASLRSGEYVIVWRDDRNTYGDIYAQRYSQDGIAIGGNFLVNDDQTRIMIYPRIAALANGGFVISWRAYWAGNSALFFRLFSADGLAAGLPVRVIEHDISAVLPRPTVAGLSDSGFVVVWCDDRNTASGDIYARRYDLEGVPVGLEFPVNDVQGTNRIAEEPTIAGVESGGFVIAWQDNRFGNNDIFAQVYSPTGEPIGSNFQLNNTDDISDQIAPEAVSYGCMLIITWQDNRISGQGWDIFMNVIDLRPLLSMRMLSHIPQTYYISQNYPNPFNPASTIRYDLPMASDALLVIYDLLGREVTRLVDGYMEPGYHLVKWDGRDQSGRSLPSGIYIARLVTPEYTNSIKMLLLK